MSAAYLDSGGAIASRLRLIGCRFSVGSNPISDTFFFIVFLKVMNLRVKPA
jgi:hypothetical protein